MTGKGLIHPARENVASLADVGIDLDTWAALNPESRRLIESGCIGKVKYGMDTARDVAATLNASNQEDPRPVRAYSCSYVTKGGHPHCHVGHVPDLATMEAMARTVRDLHGCRPPTWVDGVRPPDVPSTERPRRKKEKRRR